MLAEPLYKKVWHVCRLTLQSGVTCLQNHFTKTCDMFVDSLYKKVWHVCRLTLQKRCGMFADSLYKEV